MSTATIRLEKDLPLGAAPANAPTIDADMTKVLKLVQASQSTVTPKEVSDHLARLTAGYDDLTARYAENSQRIDAELAALKQEGGTLSSHLHQLNAEVHQHGGSLDAFAASTNTDLDRLSTGISALNSLLEVQDAIINEQSTRLDEFDSAFELLDTATRGNKARIEVVREEAEKKHAVVQTQIQGLEALQRDHYAQFVQLRQLVGVLHAETQRLDKAIQGVAGNLAAHVGATRYNFNVAAGTSAALLVLTLTGFALFKWSPAYMPTTVQTALTQTSNRIDDMTQRWLPGMESRTVEQEKQIGQLNKTVATLEKNVSGLRKSLSSLRNNVLGASALPAIHGSDWLLQQKPASYTVQLLGVSSEQEMNSFIELNAEQLQGATLAESVTRRDQRDRFNLFYGVYPSQDAAKQAIDALPPALRSQKPWIRPLSSVQAALK